MNFDMAADGSSAATRSPGQVTHAGPIREPPPEKVHGGCGIWFRCNLSRQLRLQQGYWVGDTEPRQYRDAATAGLPAQGQRLA